MTLDDIIKIQSVIDKREPAKDTIKLLEKKRFSKSKNQEIRLGNMHIDHLLRSLNLNGFLNFNKTKTEIETEQLIEKLKATFVKINNLERGV
tara:strand:- start:380 stop:655 length:276 start_codon:yes stop_codon:yes gene_type:complete